MRDWCKENPPYEGAEPYLYLAFAEADKGKVWEFLRLLLARGCRVWYARGQAGSSEELLRRQVRYKGAALTLLYLTDRACGDPDTKSAVLVNQKAGRPILCIDPDGKDRRLAMGLREDAQDLVSKGKFREFHIEYPRGGWELDRSGFSLMSLEELDTLPDAMLRRVTGFCMAGNTLADPNTSDIREEWHDGSEVPSLLIHEFDTDRLTPVEDGEGPVSNVDFLNTLTGLRTLKLYRQPLDSLDGIQNFGDLEFLSLCFCRNLTDLSPAFTLQNLRSLSVKECPVESIQGIQNLTGLWELDLSGSEVSDLSPLEECDFSAGINETGGFNLCLNGAPVEDYSPLSSIPVYDNLEINDVDPVRYLSYLEGIPIHRYFAANAFTERSSAEDADALFAQFVQGHPELTEVGVPWNNRITDLTPLLELEHLQKVRVSSIMEEAISSLDGEDVRFELEIEGE